jgi:hypothetical protein
MAGKEEMKVGTVADFQQWHAGGSNPHSFSNLHRDCDRSCWPICSYLLQCSRLCMELQALDRNLIMIQTALACILT